MRKSDNKFFERFKRIENCFNQELLLNSPAICKIKLQNYNKIRKQLQMPYDTMLHLTIAKTTRALCEDLNNIQFAYIQGSEISFLLSDYKKNEENPFLDNNVQKINSYFSAKSTLFFQRNIDNDLYNKIGDVFFTSKVFSIPKDEVINYFILQQRNCIHDSIHYWHDYYLPNDKNKHSDLKLKPQEILVPTWDECPSLHFKHGTFFRRLEIDKEARITSGSFEFNTKYGLIPQETVTRKKWTPIPMKIRFEDDRKIIEELL